MLKASVGNSKPSHFRDYNKKKSIIVLNEVSGTSDKGPSERIVLPEMFFSGCANQWIIIKGLYSYSVHGISLGRAAKSL